MLYQPPPTIERFMLSDALVRCVAGPIGSGKSMGSIMELLRRARQQAPDQNGIRNTRYVLVRNTMQQLRSTVLTDVQQYLKDMVRYFVTDHTIQIRADLDDGTKIVSDWLLVPLDTKEDQRRLLSLQLSGAWINECREVPIEIVQALLGRLGRFPSKINGGPSWHGLIMDTNPWDVDSPYHDRFVLNPHPNWQLFHQPSGVGPFAENRENLPDGYYENLASDRDEGWTSVHIYSEWGSSNAGQAVFRRSFNAETHVVDMLDVVNPFRPLIVGQDFGRTPTALIGQTDAMGRILIYKEITSEDMGLLQFAEEKLRPALMGEPYAGKRVLVVADPAGREKSQLTEESAYDVLKSLGFLVYPAPTNDIEPRLRSVERALRTTIQGEPGLQISRTGCPSLIKALASNYRYRRKRDGVLEDVPEKNHPWSDLCFVAGTPIATPAGSMPIETLRVGDAVISHLGTNTVVRTGSRMVDDTIIIALSNGIHLQCTPDHPFRLGSRWVRADMLREGDILERVQWVTTSKSSWATAIIATERTAIIGGNSVSPATPGSALVGLCRKAWSCTIKTAILATTRLRTWSWSLLSSIWRCSGLNKLTPTVACGGNANSLSGASAQSHCTSPFGSTTTDRAQTACRSIIKTAIRPIMTSPIWRLGRHRNTAGSTSWPGLHLALLNRLLQRLLLVPPFGTPATPASPGTVRTAFGRGSSAGGGNSAAPAAANFLRATPAPSNAAFARHTVSPPLGGPPAWIMKPELAAGVEAPSPATATSESKPALRVVAVSCQRKPVRVFNLEVEGAHTYYAGEALVHNCDALQYLCMGAAADLSGRVMLRDRPRSRAPLVTAAAWT